MLGYDSITQVWNLLSTNLSIEWVVLHELFYLNSLSGRVESVLDTGYVFDLCMFLFPPIISISFSQAPESGATSGGKIKVIKPSETAFKLLRCFGSFDPFF